MANYYMAVSIEVEGKHFARLIKVAPNSNILSVIAGIANIKTANIFGSKRRSEEIINAWNESYRQNGTYLFAQEARPCGS